MFTVRFDFVFLRGVHQVYLRFEADFEGTGRGDTDHIVSRVYLQRARICSESRDEKGTFCLLPNFTSIFLGLAEFNENSSNVVTCM